MFFIHRRNIFSALNSHIRISGFFMMNDCIRQLKWNHDSWIDITVWWWRVGYCLLVHEGRSLGSHFTAPSVIWQIRFWTTIKKLKSIDGVKYQSIQPLQNVGQLGLFKAAGWLIEDRGRSKIVYIPYCCGFNPSFAILGQACFGSTGPTGPTNILSSRNSLRYILNLWSAFIHVPDNF